MPAPDPDYVCPYTPEYQLEQIKPCADLWQDGRCKFISYASMTGPHAPAYPIQKAHFLGLGYIEMTIPEMTGFVLPCADHPVPTP